MKDEDLWSRLKAYDFPLSAGRSTLAGYLAATYKVSSAQAERLVAEYRRFLYLAATCDRVVVPSSLVDQVWHVHLTDTRAYLDDFCGKVVGRIIHHSPGRPRAALDPGYRDTLDLYLETFGVVPTRRIWPTVEWLQSRKWRWGTLFLTTAASVAIAPMVNVYLPLIVIPLAIVVYGAVEKMHGTWSLQRDRDGSGCGSGTFDGDGGGCGGD